ncbi:MAG: ABC transporter permease [Lachnospiraceae bacterium]|nr:ABC transporter permease [Lachnospiraceae bacterium]MEE0861425.1 ABC transporter permease [Lachnospiraceae bacterium]
MNKTVKKNALFASPYIVWIAAFIIIPLLFILYYGFTDRAGKFTLENIKAIARPEYYEALILSLVLAVVSTLICLLLAYPLALILRNMNMSKQGFIVFVFILPMWMNFLLRTYAWQAILDINGILDLFLAKFGITGFNIINTPAAIILGMVYDYLPFMVLPIYNVLVKIDDNVINAARDLGANFWQTLFKIIIPLSKAGIASGIIMVFVPSLTTFVISDILGGGKLLLIGNIVENKVKADNLNLAAGLSLVLMIFIVVNMMFSGDDETSSVKVKEGK